MAECFLRFLSKNEVFEKLNLGVFPNLGNNGKKSRKCNLGHLWNLIIVIVVLGRCVPGETFLVELDDRLGTFDIGFSGWN